MNGNNLAIRVDAISKLYRIGLKEERHDTVGGAVLDFIKSPLKNYRKYRSLYRFDDVSGGDDAGPQDVIWALRDISFEVNRGEVIGIIGHNGAGKSTLLKILSRITDPTTGRAEIYGRVGSLLEVGTGFHPELTGRENIYLNGTILGMKKREVDEKFDEIAEFSGIGKFIDTPVKRYSSGMRIRVGFAVAAHLEPEILVIDEVLSVRDVEFQDKCIGKMKDGAGQGRTVLFVSHNLSAVQALCTRGLLLRHGKVVMDGPVDEIVEAYLDYLGRSAENPFEDNPERSGHGKVRITGARILDFAGSGSTRLIAGRSALFEFEYENPGNVSRANITMTIYNQIGVAVTNFDVGVEGFQIDSLEKKGIFRCHVPKLPLPLGRYRVAVAIYQKAEIIDHIPNVLNFSVEGSVYYPTGKTQLMRYCSCMVDHHWEHNK